MKKILAIFILVFCFSDLVEAGGSTSAEFAVCVEFGSSLSFRIDHEKLGLPTSWDDFEKVRIMKKGTMKHQLFTAKVANSFALVPGAPLIKPQTGIPPEYAGYRLVLISRKETASKSSGIGRCALLVDSGGENTKKSSVHSVFLTEDVARIILNQIDGFDPIKQPLAFEDLSPFELEERQFRDNIKTTADVVSLEDTNQSNTARSLRDNRRPDSSLLGNPENSNEESGVPGWIVVSSFVVLVLALASWLRSRSGG